MAVREVALLIRMDIPKITADLSREELWRQTAKALDGGDFSWLDELLCSQNASVIELLEANGEPIEYMNEAFAWTCFTGRTRDAEILLDKGVDPAASDKTGLAGFHWAANRGNLETVRMLIERGAPLEQLNTYDGTVLGCALYSAAFEHRRSHASIIEALIEAGAVVTPALLAWWENLNVPSLETKKRVTQALRNGTIE